MPETEMEPDLAVPVLAATVYVKDPLPVPEAVPVMVIHVAFETAVHWQAAVVVTVTDALTPVADAVAVVGESV